MELLENFNLNENKFETLFFLFLPNFNLETPFHFLLSNEKIHIFDSIAQQIDTNLFEEFLKNHEYIKKIESMFIYILENVNSFYFGAIEDFYCSFIYSYDFDLDESTDKNLEKIEGYLQSIKLCLINVCNHPELT